MSSDKTIEKAVFCSCKGIVAMLLIIVGFLGHFIALPFADLTLIACNSSSAVLMNVFISAKYLGEKFVPRYDITAMMLVFLGTLVIILLSNKEQQVFTTPDLLELLTSVKSIVYFSLTLFFMISIKCFMPSFLRKLKRFERDCEEFDAEHEGD